jgi:activator of 2-hydroxyglutaryl-CoA dehydratase
MLGNSYCALFATKTVQHAFEAGWKIENKTVTDD